MRLLRFDFAISHVPGKELTTADALSRTSPKSKSRVNQEEEIELYVENILLQLPASDKRKTLCVLQGGTARLDSKVSKLDQSILVFKRRDILGTRTSPQRPLSHYSVIDKTGNPGQDARWASRNFLMQSPNQGIGLVARFGQITGRDGH